MIIEAMSSEFLEAPRGVEGGDVAESMVVVSLYHISHTSLSDDVVFLVLLFLPLHNSAFYFSSLFYIYFNIVIELKQYYKRDQNSHSNSNL